MVEIFENCNIWQELKFYNKLQLTRFFDAQNELIF